MLQIFIEVTKCFVGRLTLKYLTILCVVDQHMPSRVRGLINQLLPYPMLTVWLKVTTIYQIVEYFQLFHSKLGN